MNSYGINFWGINWLSKRQVTTQLNKNVSQDEGVTTAELPDRYNPEEVSSTMKKLIGVEQNMNFLLSKFKCRYDLNSTGKLQNFVKNHIIQNSVNIYKFFCKK